MSSDGAEMKSGQSATKPKNDSMAPEARTFMGGIHADPQSLR